LANKNQRRLAKECENKGNRLLKFVKKLFWLTKMIFNSLAYQIIYSLTNYHLLFAWIHLKYKSNAFAS
jgi:hypothetical protein